MEKRKKLFYYDRLIEIIILTLFAIVANARGSSYSLNDCYKLATTKSASVAQEKEQVIQAEAQLNQAYSKFYPSISLDSSILKQDSSESNLGQSLFPNEQTTIKASLNYNLFRGFKDFVIVDQKKNNKKAANERQKQANLNLYRDTANAFFSIINYEKEIENLNQELKSHQKRRSELLSFKRSGRSRNSDIIAIDLTIAKLKASVLKNQALLFSSKEVLSYLTGLPLNISLKDTVKTPQKIQSLNEYLKQIDSHPSVSSANFDALSAEKNLSSAKKDHYPSVNLSVNKYLDRSGVGEDVHWDAMISISLPLFEGGTTRAKVKEALSIKRAKDFKYNDSRRIIQRDIKGLHWTISFNIEKLKELDHTQKLAMKKYKLTLKDSKKGLATNSDVLLALVSAHQAKRDYDNALYKLKYDYINLELLSGRQNVKSLREQM